MKSKIITSVRLLGHEYNNNNNNNNNNKRMSKTLKTIALTILLCTITANAQITKGNWMVGGSGNFDYAKTEPKNTNSSGTNINYTDNGTYSITLDPNIGYFIKDKLAIGMKISLVNSFIKFRALNLNDTYISISPNFRYYFLNVDKTYNVFIEPSFNYYTNNSLGNSSGFGLKSGFEIFLNSSVGIEPSLNYIYNESNQYKRNNFFIGIGVQVHLEKEK